MINVMPSSLDRIQAQFDISLLSVTQPHSEAVQQRSGKIRDEWT
jgi:hypothetical protein